MPKFVVSYDLRGSRNYEGLYRLLRAYPEHKAITESTWCVVTGWTAEQVRNHLQKALDADDQLIVFELTGQWAATSALNPCFDWLWKHIGAKPTS